MGLSSEFRERHSESGTISGSAARLCLDARLVIYLTFCQIEGWDRGNDLNIKTT